MTDSLFEILLKLCETSLEQLQKSHQSMDLKPLEAFHEEELFNLEEQNLHVKSQLDESTRVVTDDEQIKMTKASYQFLMRMKLYGVIDNDLFELIMNQFLCSESRIITQEETRWTLRAILARNLSDKELAFLDLVLYQREDELTIH